MIFEKEIKKMAEEFNYDTALEYEKFLAGAAALENLIMKSVDEFDGNSINDYITTYIDVSGQSPSYEDVAKYQFETDQLIIGALREEIEWRKESYSDLDDINIKLNYKIQQLEQKIKELENGK